MRIVCAVTLFAFIISLPVQAGNWLSEWLDNYTATEPMYFEGQKRGYFTAGSISVRTPTRKDYLLSLTPPSVHAGCGGIDVFGGSFSFMNFDYLVQKLQRVLQAAPAVAFDLALNTLCSPCSTIMKAMESIGNQLNQLQFDECKAAKTLVTMPINMALGGASGGDYLDWLGKSTIGAGDESIWKNIKDVFSSLKSGGGDSDYWEGVKKRLKEYAGKYAPPKTVSSPGGDQATASGLTSGCRWEVAFLFSEGSVLQHIGTIAGQYDSDLIAMVRGLVGDVIIKVDNDTGKASAVEILPCANSDQIDIRKFLSGEFEKREVDAQGNPGQCTRVVADKGLNALVSEKVAKIVEAFKSNRKLDDDERRFIDATPVPVYSILKVATIMNNADAVQSDLSKLVASAYAYRLLLNLYDTGIRVLRMARAYAESEAQSKRDCVVSAQQDVFAKIGNLEFKIEEWMGKAMQHFQSVRTEHANTMQLVQRYEDFSKYLQSTVFGKMYLGAQ